MSVLVLGVLSYPSLLPNLDQDITAFDFQLQLANVAFADDEEEEDGEDEFENDEFEEEEEEHDEEDAVEDALDAIADAQEEIDKAQAKIDEAAEKEKETTLAQEQLDDAVEILNNAQDSFDLGDFEEAEELAEDAEDLANEARGKLIGKTQEDLEEDEDELEFEGIIVSIGSNSFTLQLENGTIITIFTNDETEFEDLEGFGALIKDFAVEVEIVLSNSSLVATEIEPEEEIEIEVEVEHGVAKVKVEFNDQKTKFVEDFVDEDSIAESILNEVPDLPLDKSQIMAIWDLDIEEEDEDMSSKIMHEHEEEAMQTALDLIYELQQRIEQLEANIQTLLEKYESGAYFGTVPEVDSEIKSYTITFDGSATSIDDESIVDVEGEIFLENLLTFGDNISKFRVTGGEISIDNTFYDIVFGKARVSSSGSSGEKDIVVLLGQVIDFADEDDDSSTLKLVINSETSLEGDFGLVPISIEILPQSKIAGQWYLSGSGQLSLLEG